MTIIDAIHAIDKIKPNKYTEEQKVKWLSALDGMIKRELLDQYIGTVDFEPYDADTDRSKELIVGAPYEEVYITWLESKIDYHNGEYDRYNSSVTRFDNIFTAYKKDYNRTHVHKSARMTYF